MKQTKTKLLCLLLAALMLLSCLTACGKDKAKDSNLIKLGDYELLYKGACIMEDSDGNDAIVLTLDFTNNGKENASYLWSVDESMSVSLTLQRYEAFSLPLFVKSSVRTIASFPSESSMMHAPL